MEYQHIHILCEGQSEESFVNKILAPYLEPNGIYVKPVMLGGVSRYSCIRKDLKRLGQDSSAMLTTMLDYYKLPQDVPGVSVYAADKQTNPTEIARFIEEKIKEDLHKELACIEFFPYIQMHEYEALLLSNVDSFHNIKMKPSAITKLKKDIQKFPTPEHVNNSVQTAPSKRILKAYQYYQKVSDGTIVAESIGIETMMDKCLHFADWVRKLKTKK